MNWQRHGEKHPAGFLVAWLVTALAVSGTVWLVFRASRTLAADQEERPTAEAISKAGILRGTVSIQSPIQSKSSAVSIYSQRAATKPTTVHPMPEGNELENVVLYLEGSLRPRQQQEEESAEGLSSPGAERARNLPPPVMRQLNETFVPHVLPILAGTSVEFPNSDPFFHNVFSLSGPKSFDLGRYPQGQKRTVRFDKPGMVKVFCHIHTHMSAVILVFDHPFFTVPDPKGQFIFSALPPGHYTLVGWHERLKLVKKPITIKESGTVAVDLIL